MPIRVLRLPSPSVQFQINAIKQRLENQPDHIYCQKLGSANHSYVTTNNTEIFNIQQSGFDVFSQSTAYSEILAGNTLIDLQRVGGIKLALENGFFKLDPMRIANKLYEFEKELEHI